MAREIRKRTAPGEVWDQLLYDFFPFYRLQI